jgi:hypothetical protein
VASPEAGYVPPSLQAQPLGRSLPFVHAGMSEEERSTLTEPLLLEPLLLLLFEPLLLELPDL